ncbi:MAG: hypothetical protein ABEI58_04140 [Candidatus Nanohaloarchaea archaeon]
MDRATMGLSILVLFLVGSASAASFGSFPYDTSRTSEGNTTFEIGVFNLGDRKLELEMVSDTPAGVEVVFPQKTMVLPPSRTTKNPAGSGWLSLGDGRYVEVRRVPFRVLSHEPGKHRVKVSVRASRPSGVEEGDRTRQKVVRVNQYSFTVDAEAALGASDKGVDTVLGDDGFEIVRKDRDENRKPEVDLNRSDNKDSNTGVTDSLPEGPGIDTMTVILLLAAMASTAYLLKVI